ncbi:MAG: TonB-dependent receptor [Bacteroidetes bacterium]|jgi:hypothetical protein|nr:TonB-dependent receptor [Bacteroidota bacterium]
MRTGIILISCFLLSLVSNSQTFSIKGNIIDKKDTSTLIGVAVILVNKTDSAQFKGVTTDLDGNYEFPAVAPGSYTLKVEYIGYKQYLRAISVVDKNITVNVKLEQDALLLKDVDVTATQTRVTQKGDTTEINAGAYKVNTDATTEDLVKKMPGITVENGVVKAQGEDVKKVLIDGKEFFGDDAALALKNLPAEVVDKIQVFDKLSDQAQFTGFNDGNTSKTLNIVTKKGMNNGTFGKVYAGYGTDNRYQAGGNLNYFKGDRKISVLGIANNINQQNFSSQDLLGVSQSSSGGSRGGMRGSGMRGMGGSSDPTSNFLSGQQGGISATNSIGLNYSDLWNKKVKFTGSYFFNNSNNSNENTTNRSYFQASDEGNQLYSESSKSESHNFNHRANMRIEYTIDTMNTLIFTPQLSFQTNNSESILNGFTSYASSGPVSSLNNSTKSKNEGYNASNNILYMHKFMKTGRTMSFNLGTTFNSKEGTSNLYSSSVFYNPDDSAAVIDQRTTSSSGGYNLSGMLMYTEPVSKTGQFFVNYSPSVASSNSAKNTNRLDTLSDSYSTLDTILSNRFDNMVVTQKGGVGIRIRKEKSMFNIGVDYQNLYLSGEQVFPRSFAVNKYFNSVLPKAMFRYKFSKTNEVRINYSAGTQVPSINQLQNVIDNSNPLYLSSGNPNLVQQYNHTFNTRYNKSNPDKGRTFFVLLNATASQNYIANSTFIARQDTFISDGVLLARGSQLSKPMNLDNYYSSRALVTFGFPVKFIKSNLNMSAGVNYQHSPGLINSVTNYSNSYSINGGLIVSSNISEKVDFTLGYTPNYTIVENTIQKSSNNNYYIGMASAKINVMPWKGLVLNTEATHSSYVGLSSSFNQEFLLWNAAVGYKFLKNNAAELRLSVFDILSQNNSIARNITENYVEDVQTKILKQYFMLTFTYNFKKFGSKEKAGDNTKDETGG